MNRAKYVVFAVCAVILAVGAGVVSSDRRAPAHIALSISGGVSEHNWKWLEGVKAHPAVEKGEVEVTVYPSNDDLERMETLCDVIALGGVDAAIVMANQSEMGERFVHRMEQAGVPVWAAVKLRAGPVQGYIGPDDVLAGYLTAKAVFEKMGGRGSVVVLRGAAGSVAAAERDEGIEKALAEYPGIVVAARLTGDWIEGEAFAQMQQWLLRSPGRAEGIVAQNDDMAIGALKAMALYGEKAVPVAGIDGSPAAVRAVADAEMLQTLRQDAVMEAQGTLDAILDSLAGTEGVARSAYHEAGNGRPAGFRVLSWKRITADNAAGM